MGAAAAGLAGAAGLGGIFAGNKAASAGRGAANSAYDNLEQSKGQALERLDPYSNYGRQALVPLSALLFGKNFDPAKGEFTGDVSEGDRFNAFQQSPGYQYQLGEGLKAIERKNAATGTLLSGNTLKELQGYGTNLANEDYYNYINTLVGQAGIGATADTNAANVISNLGGQMAGFQYAGGMANAQKYSNLSNALFGLAGMGASASLSSMDGGSPAASGGSAGTYNSSFFSNAAAGSGGGAGLSSAFAASDINLKENIEKVGEEKGFNIYEFNYKGYPQRYRGVMAQEVQKIKSSAVRKINGFLAVDYNKIGLQFKKLA